MSLEILKDFKKTQWDDAYEQGNNFVFYPNEEIVRFLSKYVRKRIGISKFQNIMVLPEKEWENFKSLDLGCGIGRHVKLLNEFGLNPYGVDLSKQGIETGKSWFHSLGLDNLADNLMVGSVSALPYEDSFFHICVSYGVLDCMEYSIATQGIQEAHRVLKKDGLMYLGLWMEVENVDQEVLSEYSIGTIEHYFTMERIREFLFGLFDIVEIKIVDWKDEAGLVVNGHRRAHIIVKKI